MCQLPPYDHVVIVVMENKDVDQIVGNSVAPYINSLIADSSCAFFTQSVGLTHPSQPNYLYLFSGSNQGVIDNDVPQNLPFTTPNLGASLRAKGLTFLGFAEDMPKVGSTDTSTGLYARKHNPWVNWQGTGANNLPGECNLPFSYFPESYTTLPTVAFVVPNMENDMHNGVDDSVQIAAGDAWLHNNFEAYIQWSKKNNSLFILTFDENNFTPENRITTLFIGQKIKSGNYNRPISHINVLRTLERMFGLSPSGIDSADGSIDDCWINTVSYSENIFNGQLDNFFLDQNFPNPFNPTTTINYRVPVNGFVTLKVFDLLGREVAQLINKEQNAGSYSVTFDGKNASSGLNFYQLQSGNFVSVKKMMLIK
jgi:hypothetical protein